MVFIGGCGAMYEISVISDQFQGMSIVKQHRLVNEVSLNMSISVTDIVIAGPISTIYCSIVVKMFEQVDIL